MSQGNNPFASISSNSIPQPILPSSNPNRPSTSSQPQQQQQQQGQQQEPPTPRSFQTIAPDPVGLREIQRQHQEHEETSKARPLKRPFHQTSMDAPAPPALKDEDKLLLQLKDEQQLPWKNIVARFQQETGKVHAIAALQMRYKRLKDRLQVWTDPDVEALKQAHDYWESRKFDIISAKVCSIDLFHERDRYFLSRMTGLGKRELTRVCTDAGIWSHRKVFCACLQTKVAGIKSKPRIRSSYDSYDGKYATYRVFAVFITAANSSFRCCLHTDPS